MRQSLDAHGLVFQNLWKVPLDYDVKTRSFKLSKSKLCFLPWFFFSFLLWPIIFLLPSGAMSWINLYQKENANPAEIIVSVAVIGLTIFIIGLEALVVKYHEIVQLFKTAEKFYTKLRKGICSNTILLKFLITTFFRM